MKRMKINLAKIGDHPGSVRYTGGKEPQPATVEQITYNAKKVEKETVENLNAMQPYKSGVNWIRVTGVQDTGVIEKIGKRFNMDALVLEDIANVGTRSKIDDYGAYIFWVFDTLYSDDTHTPIQEQISIVRAGNTVISFQEYDSELFDPVIRRILENKGIVRRNNADFLVYCLIDTIVDQQFVLLNDFEEKMDRLEIAIINETHRGQARGIYALKRELLVLKNSIWPMRDIVGTMIADEDMDRNMRKHYRDVEDHIKQIMDYTTIYRELMMGMYETYLSNISNRMNKIMTTLTVFSVIFIPLTFLTGVYGMNFHYFPELDFRWAYPVFWAVCGGIGLGMFLFFKKKKWM